MQTMDGVIRCSRYAFGPNRLHYCGPAKSGELRDYINDDSVDLGLKEILSQFETMYPYLIHIAVANGIRDPLDPRVVEAYWLGNGLLEKVGKNDLYRHLIDGLGIKNKLGNKEFERLAEKIGEGAVPHHSFHVLDIWKRTGHVAEPHTIESMDECRVSTGTVVSATGPFVTVMREPLLYIGNKLSLGVPTERKLVRELEAEYDIEQIKPGDIVSIHWGVICEVLTKPQAAALKKYTKKHIELANTTL